MFDEFYIVGFVVLIPFYDNKLLSMNNISFLMFSVLLRLLVLQISNSPKRIEALGQLRWEVVVK